MLFMLMNLPLPRESRTGVSVCRESPGVILRCIVLRSSCVPHDAASPTRTVGQRSLLSGRPKGSGLRADPDGRLLPDLLALCCNKGAPRIGNAHSTCCIFESRMILAHWAISAFIIAEKSSGLSVSAV
jgi:hypothetical protein